MVKAVDGDGPGGPEQKQSLAFWSQKRHGITSQMPPVAANQKGEQVHADVDKDDGMDQPSAVGEQAGKRIVPPAGARSGKAAIGAAELISTYQFAASGAQQRVPGRCGRVHQGPPLRSESPPTAAATISTVPDCCRCIRSPGG
jgi:hypothetical protein